MSAEEQVALVTGGGEPLAQGVARELLLRDWTVLLQANPPGASAEAADESPRGRAETPGRGQPAICTADLTDPAGREQLVDFALDEFGRIDLLVVVPGGPSVSEDLLELSEPACRQVLEAYLTGPLFLTQLVANEMVRLGEAGTIEAAKIVLVNSIGAYTTSTDRAAYCLARAAGSMLTRLLADRLGEHGIRVYEIRAGLISTGGGDEVHARYDRLINEGLTPLRRWGRPQDVGLAVAAVAEDLLPYSTGEVINVDGGFHLRRL